MTPDWTKPNIEEKHLGQFSDKPKPIPGNPEPEKEKDTIPRELNGPKGLEPTRYGDWERKGICYDF